MLNFRLGVQGRLHQRLVDGILFHAHVDVAGLHGLEGVEDGAKAGPGPGPGERLVLC